MRHNGQPVQQGTPVYQPPQQGTQYYPHQQQQQAYHPQQQQQPRMAPVYHPQQQQQQQRAQGYQQQAPVVYQHPQQQQAAPRYIPQQQVSPLYQPPPQQQQQQQQAPRYQLPSHPQQHVVAHPPQHTYSATSTSSAPQPPQPPQPPRPPARSQEQMPLLAGTTRRARAMRESAVIRLEVLGDWQARFMVWVLFFCVVYGLLSSVSQHSKEIVPTFLTKFDSDGTGPFYPSVRNPHNETILFLTPFHFDKKPSFFTALHIDMGCGAEGWMWTQNPEFTADIVGFVGNYPTAAHITDDTQTAFSYTVSGEMDCAVLNTITPSPLVHKVFTYRAKEDHSEGQTGSNLTVGIFLQIEGVDGFSYTKGDAAGALPPSSPTSHMFDGLDISVDITYTTYGTLFLLLRLVCIASLVFHMCLFGRRLSRSADPLRLEHRVVQIGFVFMILACGPFSVLTLSSEDTTYMSALLIYQVPRLAIQYSQCALFTIVRDVSRRAAAYSRGRNVRAQVANIPTVEGYVTVVEEKKRKPERPWRWLWSLFFLLAGLQVLLVVLSGEPSAGMNDSAALASGRSDHNEDGIVTVFGVYMILNFYIGIKVAVALFGGWDGLYTVMTFFCCVCCGSCSAKSHLKTMLYFPSRDRQILLRFLRVLTFTAYVYVLISTLIPLAVTYNQTGTTYSGSSSSGINIEPVIFLTIFYHFLAWGITPVFSKQSQGEKAVKPPTPVNDAWKTTRWPDAVKDRRGVPKVTTWLRSTPGVFSLYQFATLREEQTFREINRGSANYFENVFFFNYESVLAAMHFSDEAYRMDWVSPAISAFAAGVAILTHAAVIPPISVESDDADSDGWCLVDENVPSEEPPIVQEDFVKPSILERIRGGTSRAKMSLLTMPKIGKRGPSAVEKKGFLSLPDKPDGGFFYEVLHVTQKAAMQVVFMRWQGRLVVCFRGSSNAANWKSDLNMPQVRWEEMLEVPKDHYTTAFCASKQALVHRGFAKLWAKIREVVFDNIRRLRRKDEKIVVTGHSLGAAMATLASYSISTMLIEEAKKNSNRPVSPAINTSRLSDPSGPLYGSSASIGDTAKELHIAAAGLEVYTFGCPLVGNEMFTLIYNQAIPCHLRVVNKNDLITWATVPFQKSRHAGKLCFVANDTGMLSIEPSYFEALFSPKANLFSPCGLVDTGLFHSCKKYMTALSTAFDAHRTDEGVHQVPGWAKEEVFQPGDNKKSGCCC